MTVVFASNSDLHVHSLLYALVGVAVITLSDGCIGQEEEGER